MMMMVMMAEKHPHSPEKLRHMKVKTPVWVDYEGVGGAGFLNICNMMMICSDCSTYSDILVSVLV